MWGGGWCLCSFRSKINYEPAGLTHGSVESKCIRSSLVTFDCVVDHFASRRCVHEAFVRLHILTGPRISRLVLPPMHLSKLRHRKSIRTFPIAIHTKTRITRHISEHCENHTDALRHAVAHRGSSKRRRQTFVGHIQFRAEEMCRCERRAFD